MFSKFCFSRFLFRGVKGQKIAQMTKNYVCHAWYLGNHTSGSSFAIHKCKMIISPGFFFSEFWFFRLLSGSKGKKWSKLTKAWSFALYISGTILHMILIYGAHVWKDNISWCFLHFFKILIFWVVRGVKG